MANIAQRKAEQNRKQRRTNRIRQRIVGLLGCAVVFITTYALILPAITMEKSCELEEHTHVDACYSKVESQTEKELTCTEESLGIHVHVRDCHDSEKNLTCGQADFVVHSHAGDCYDKAGALICSLAEIEEHTHEDDCYEIVEPEQGHVHTDACYQTTRGDLTCQIHIHGDSCYTQGQLTCRLPEESPHVHGEGCTTRTLTCTLSTEPHTHSETCYGLELCQEEHQHGLECALPKLICDLGEEAHTHGDACYKTEYLCGLTEAGHLHGSDCYEKVLTCGVEGVDSHEHTDACYAQQKVLTCGQEEKKADSNVEPEKVLVCGKEIIKLHTHKDDCYETYLDDNQQEQVRLICEERVVLEHIHSDSCFTEKETAEQPEELTCGKEESLGHAHGDNCFDAEGKQTCTLEASEGHVHTARCYGVWELTCGKEEHIHGDACSEADQEEIPLVRPLICTVEEHTHDALCFGEAADGVSICEKIEHTHTADCYGEAVATFPYEDDQISMTVTVANRLGLPEGLNMEVLLLDAEDQDYTAYEGYAMENTDGELLGLTGYQIQFFYEGQQIQLPDAQVTAELTLKPVEYQQTEEPTIQQTIADNGVDLFVTEKFAQAAAFMSLRMAAPAADPEPAEDTGEKQKTVQVTVLQQGEDDIVSRGTASFSGEETLNNQMTLSLTGSNTFALVNQSLTNPEFTVQYYANFPVMQRFDSKPTGSSRYFLEVIDTSDDGDGDGGNLPKNETAASIKSTYLELRQVPGLSAKNDMHSSLGKTEVKDGVFEVKTVLTQTQVYNDYPLQYVNGMGIEHMDALYENDHYNLVDLWISEDNGANWKIYTTVPIATESYNQNDKSLTVAEGVEPCVSENAEVFGQWYHAYNDAQTAIDYNKPWYRKFRQNAGDTTTVAIPHTGDVNHIVRVNSINDLTFTNNEQAAAEDPTAVLINQEGITIRLVYDLPRSDEQTAANFYDYNISDSKVYRGTVSDDIVTPDNGSDTAQAASNKTGNYNDILYMKTSGTSDAYGINNSKSYYGNTNATAHLAFGNSNTGVFRASDKVGDYYINRANKETYKDCSFGIVTDLDSSGQKLEYNSKIAHQALFNEEITGAKTPLGKVPYYNQQLVFRRMGDTYILTGVNGQVSESKLNQFIAPCTFYKREEILFTNSFWPMDGVAGDTVAGHDMMFGSLNEDGTNEKKRQYVYNEGSTGDLPDSDDGLRHNSYFGMNYSVEFQMDGKYCGPLEYLFYGDDDMWVFLTNLDTGKVQQICDIGGVHSSIGSYTDLWDYIPRNTPGAYRLNFFYTERGASGSSCYMAFTLPNMASIPQQAPELGNITVMKAVPNAATDEEFTFKFDLGGDIADNFAYILTHSTGNESGYIQDGETFKLKKNEKISITGIPQGMEYTISEQLPESQQDGYSITWLNPDGIPVEGNTVNGTVQSATTHTYTCTNQALGSLEVGKTVTGVSDGDISTLGSFEVKVTLTDADGKALNGTFGQYEFKEGETTVSLKHGEKAEFTGIPVGSLFTVQETTTDGYNVSYMLDDEMQYGENGKPATNVSGTIQHNSTASIHVVNATGYELPDTGGSGTIHYTMAGLLLILLSTAYLTYSSKVRRKGAN